MEDDMSIRISGFLTCGVVWLSFATTLLLTSQYAVAEARVVRGKVVKIVPITETITRKRTGTTCKYPKPTTYSGLTALIGWDLRHNCDTIRSTEVVTGYQVFYQWDDRTYTRTMSERPGATVPLLLTVD